VDLVFLAPDDAVVAVEVKGTVVPGRIPRLSRRDLTQMSAAWVDKSGNPGMVELGLQSQDVYGGVVAINFADQTWRAALPSDFVNLCPVNDRFRTCASSAGARPSPASNGVKRRHTASHGVTRRHTAPHGVK
jgi:hypothetical protein